MKTILIVDDNQEGLYMLEFLLKSKGFTVKKATNGGEALLKALKKTPDLVISDILMPEIDGYMLCREWMKSKKLKNIPFIFYTATYTDPRDEQFALSLGAAKFIIKPSEPKQFIKIINDVLTLYDSQQVHAAQAPTKPETFYLRQYNQTLIRKLEKKMVQLEKANQSLKKEIEKQKRTEKALIKSKESLNTSLEEKKLLLKEIHHRVKNNLQIIMSLLDLQAHKLKNQPVLEAFQETKDRVYSMALVYDKLYEAENFTEIDVKDFLSALTTKLLQVYDKKKRISMKTKIRKIRLGIDVAFPCGLIINELLINAFKNAFPGDEPGQVSLSCQVKNPQAYEIIVRDNGPTMPNYIHSYEEDSIDLQLVKALVEQINGVMKIEKENPGPGTKIVVEFPGKSLYKKLSTV